MKTLRLFSLLAVLGLSLSLSSCAKKSAAGAGSEGGVKNPDTYTELTIGDIDSLDPAWSYDTASGEIILQVYEPLVFYKGSSLTEFEPLIAAEVPSVKNGLITDGGRTYKFPIRKGVKFHDGTPLTPQDVKYSLMRFCLQDRDGGPSSLLLEPITGYAATRDKNKLNENAFKDLDKAVTVDGDKVVVRLKEPFAPFISILATWSPIVSQKWAADNKDWDGSEASWRKFNNPKKEDSPFYAKENGTGPFKLERWTKAQKEIVLVRNDDYWRKPAALKRAVIRGVDEFPTRKLELAAGDADTIVADRGNFPDVSTLPGVKIIDDLPTVDMNPVLYFTFNIDPTANKDIGSGKLDGEGIPPDFFQDKDLRKAFEYAFDYQGFIRDVNRGKGTQAYGAIPKGLLGYDESLPRYTFDLKQAEEHFKKAWGGRVWDKGFHFTLTFNTGNTPREVMCNIIKRNVESLSPKFKIDTRGVLWSTYLEGFNAHKLPMFNMGWSPDFPDPHNFAFPFLHSKGNWPFVQRYSNPKMDKLVDQARTEIDPAKRKALYVQLQKLAYDEALQIYVINTVAYRTQRDWVNGYVYNAVFPGAPYATYLYPISKGKPGSAPAAGAPAPAAAPAPAHAGGEGAGR